MTHWGIDISGWQAGIDLDAVAAEGFTAVIAKATQGANYTSPTYAEQKAGAQRNRLRFMAYHYIEQDVAAPAQVDNYERAEPDRGVPVMLDHEQGSGDIEVLRGVHAEFVRRGYRVALLYLPRWYWRDHIGRPDLSGLPALMASAYGSDQPGYASTLYPGDTAPGWNDYGGNGVAVLQFTQRARVAGREIDAWAYRGTAAELDALFSAESEAPVMTDAQAVATQLIGPDRTGFEILGRAVETDPARNRYLTEAVAVILAQLGGGPNFEGWTQLGDSTTPRRTLVDGIAHVMRQNEQILAALAARPDRAEQ
ncbi:glycoside hydrolase family 25 protein [Nocardia brasiliensis]|uniref:glycoside hydrolase family 25 protein n=1 Tax=Nocardia brasiliensis TaxID=37326 RepID=UPI0024538F1E|nr:glycoside hydrolase family 25 protein [Nocardia brasiliensis]